MILIAAIMAASVPSTAMTLKPFRSAAACVIRKDRIGAADLAFTAPGSPDEASAAANLKALANCSNGLAPSRVADGVALQLYSELVVSRTQTPFSREAEAAIANSAVGQSEHATSEAAALNCLAALRPEAADTFIKATPDTRAERESLTTLLATVPQCVPAGARAAWSPADFRMGLARSMYRAAPVRDLVHKGY